MKRICCFVVALAMCISTAAFADEYDFLSEVYNSYESDVSVSLTVNEPMAVLSAMSGLMGIDNYVNLRLIAESLCNSKITGHIKLSTSNDFNKGKASYEIFEVVPLSFNRNIKLTAEVSFGMWIEWDITNEMNPTLRCLVKYPIFDKYIAIDLVEMLADSGINVPTYISTVKPYLQKSYLEDAGRKVTDILRKNSTLTNKADKSVITLTNTQLETFITEYIDYIIADSDETADYNLLVDESYNYMTDILPVLEEIKMFFNTYSVFDENAFVLECIKNPGGALSSTALSVNMNIELSDFFEDLKEDPAMFETPTNLSFSLNVDTAYKFVNRNVNVEFPSVSDDEIITISDLQDSEYEYYGYEWDSENCYHDERYYLYGENISSEKGTFYVSLQEFIYHANEYGYQYDLSGDGNIFLLTEESGKDRFRKAEFRVDSKEIKVDDSSYTLPNPVIMSNGMVYADTDALKYIFDINIEYAEIDLSQNMLYIELCRRSPQCHHTEEEINHFDDTEHDEYEEACEHYQVLNVSSGDISCYEVNYVKIRDVIDGIWSGCDVHYENRVLTLTDETGMSGFKTFVITVDSSEYLVDGILKTTGNPAREYCDSVYVDVNALAEIFDFEIVNPNLIYSNKYDETTDSYVWNMSYSAILIRKSPYCPHSEEELSDYYKWWEY